MDDHLIRKVKEIAIGSRQTGEVINRRQILNIAKGVNWANKPDILKELGGTAKLTDRWTRNSNLTELKQA